MGDLSWFDVVVLGWVIAVGWLRRFMLFVAEIEKIQDNLLYSS